MIRCDALIVGGGPAGSTCARMLRRAGWNVVVADRARFPRDKVCAGWLTPDVFPLLELSPAEYRDAGLTLQEITSFRTGVMGARLIETRYPRVVSYAIRRCEFDAYLLGRAQVRVEQGAGVSSMRRTADRWIVDEAFETPIVVGAGGHFCPVARHLRGGADTSTPVVAKEAEFLIDREKTPASPAPELLFCRDLEGYGWCVRKGDYLNIGLGRRGGQDFAAHVKDFISLLERGGIRVQGADIRWRGHAYLASGSGTRPLIGPGVLLVGDAAGLAYPESGEGIRPAIESGRLAAEALIAAGGRADLAALEPYATALRQRHPPALSDRSALHGARTCMGRALLGSRLFTRHVVLDRWFLRTGRQADDGEAARSKAAALEAGRL